jgi:hypothetical protein
MVLTVARVSGVMRWRRPLPVQAMCGPVPRWMSSWVSEQISLIRRPVCVVMASRAWSRRPVQVVGSGAASSASTLLSQLGGVEPDYSQILRGTL